MSPSQIVAFSVASALLIVVPGLSVLFVIGRFAAWLSAVGNALGVRAVGSVEGTLPEEAAIDVDAPPISKLRVPREGSVVGGLAAETVRC